MRIRRRLPILFGVVLVIAAIALAVVLRKHAPPEPARLLPGADGYFYVDLKWVRRANIAGQMPDVPHEPEYQQFIQATGFQFERDLDQAAFAIHYPGGQKECQCRALPDPPRFSEVFVGRIEGERLRAYLGKISGVGGQLPLGGHLQHSSRRPYFAGGGPGIRYGGGVEPRRSRW